MFPSAQQSENKVKAPRQVLDGIFAFPPNRETLGGTSYFIVGSEGNTLIDCPIFNSSTLDFLNSYGGVRWLCLTHRDAIGEAAEIQQVSNCEIVIQEQEAYLLPESNTITFTHELSLAPKLQGIWTPGYSPGSSCLYYSELGGVLFSGRHLLPSQLGKIVMFRSSKTFHWIRQIKSLKRLQASFTEETLQYICPGAHTGFLRGQGVIQNAYQQLINVNWENK